MNRTGGRVGKDLGVVLHYDSSRPSGLGLTEENSGGYVGLYSANTNLDSVDLVVFLYRGNVQAILQRFEAFRENHAHPRPAAHHERCEHTQSGLDWGLGGSRVGCSALRHWTMAKAVERGFCGRAT